VSSARLQDCLYRASSSNPICSRHLHGVLWVSTATLHSYARLSTGSSACASVQPCCSCRKCSVSTVLGYRRSRCACICMQQALLCTHGWSVAAIGPQAYRRCLCLLLLGLLILSNTSARCPASWAPGSAGSPSMWVGVCSGFAVFGGACSTACSVGAFSLPWTAGPRACEQRVVIVRPRGLGQMLCTGLSCTCRRCVVVGPASVAAYHCKVHDRIILTSLCRCHVVCSGNLWSSFDLYAWS
jgi:hypothetical protein